MRTFLAFLVLLLILLAPSAGHAQTAEEVDRDYTLHSSILGYKGVGGAIDGIRNPLLQAIKGETVRITIINAELLAHDIALLKQPIKSTEVLDVGEQASITFTATEDDTYYCTIPGHRAAGMEGKFQLIREGNAVVEGLPVIQEGRRLNLGFEDGTFQDWTVEGDAFGSTPIAGDVVLARTGDTQSRHNGTFWVSSGEGDGHRATGTMTSVAFTATQPFASFLVSGGALQDTRVELVLASNDQGYFKISGYDHAALRPVVVDLRPVQGEDLYIRIIDTETGVSEIPYIRDNKSAYISFDDFRFHASRPTFPNEFKPDEVFIMPPIDPVLNAGLSADEAANAMTVPEGFSVTLAAAEPHGSGFE